MATREHHNLYRSIVIASANNLFLSFIWLLFLSTIYNFKKKVNLSPVSWQLFLLPTPSFYFNKHNYKHKMVNVRTKRHNKRSQTITHALYSLIISYKWSQMAKGAKTKSHRPYPFFKTSVYQAKTENPQSLILYLQWITVNNSISGKNTHKRNLA